MKKKYAFLILITLLLLSGNHIYGQVTITGPDCVVPGTIYQYSIAGNWDSLSTMKVCVNGGMITDTTSSRRCSDNSAPLKAVTITWTKVGNGIIILTSSAGNTQYKVSITTPLFGGKIDSIDKTQIIGKDSLPSEISCSPGTGGSCNPSYEYQWQVSYDLVTWKDLPGASSQNLQIDSALTQSKYYRRKVVETSSGSVAYSDAAAVFVNVTGIRNNELNQGQMCLIRKYISPMKPAGS